LAARKREDGGRKQGRTWPKNGREEEEEEEEAEEEEEEEMMMKKKKKQKKKNSNYSPYKMHGEIL
jgi:hypothetical protein